MAFTLDGTPATTRYSAGTTMVATLSTTSGGDIWIIDIRVFSISVTCAVTSPHLTWNPVPGLTTSGINDGGGGHIMWQFYAVAASALTSETVTATFSGTPTDGDINLYAWTGANTSSTWDGNAGTSTTSTAPSITTTNANDLLLGALTCGSGTPTVGSGWTITTGSSDSGLSFLFSENQSVSSTGTYSATITGDTTQLGIISALKAAAAGVVAIPGILGLASAEW